MQSFPKYLDLRRYAPMTVARQPLMLLTLGLASIVGGCDVHSSNSPTFTPRLELPEHAELIAKSANLYKVDNYLYRSEQLRQADIPLIKANHIDAIISLRFFDQDEDQELINEVAQNADVTLYNQPLKSWHVTPAEVAQILQKIKTLQAQNQHVLVHCYHGADRTGLIIAMHRIIHQGWTIDQARKEMTKGGFGYHPIWINLENMLNPATVQAVRQELAILQSPTQHIL